MIPFSKYVRVLKKCLGIIKKCWCSIFYFKISENVSVFKMCAKIPKNSAVFLKMSILNKIVQNFNKYSCFKKNSKIQKMFRILEMVALFQKKSKFSNKCSCFIKC